MNARRARFGVVAGCMWVMAFMLAVAASGAHAATHVYGGVSDTDVCRQDGTLSSIACGVASYAGESGVVVGVDAHAQSYSSVVVGTHAGAESPHSISIGGPASVDNVLYFAYTIGDGAIAVGAGAHAFDDGSISFGMRAVATGARSVVLGDRSTDDGLAGVVSFGNADFHRDLIYVKDITSSGVVSADSFLASGAMEVESATVRNGLIVSAGGASITGGIEANNAKIVGVAGGEISATSLEAVNGSQLHQTNLNVQAAHAGALAAQADAQAAQAAAQAAHADALAAQADALAALAGLEQLVNQLLQAGVCNVGGGSIDCSSNLEMGGGKAGAGASHAIAIGGGAHAQSSGSIAMGHHATAIQPNSVAIGAGATALSSVAVGTGAQATGANSTAIGDNAVASGDYAAALGNEARATHDNSVAIGSGSTTSGPDTVSVGSPGHERRITHVAPGVAGTDAVNVNQLYAAINGLSGVSRQYVDDRIASLRVETARGIAAAAAMRNVQPSAVGKTAEGIGIGHFAGQTAIGFSLAQAPKEGVLLSLGAAGALGSGPIVQAGMSFEF